MIRTAYGEEFAAVEIHRCWGKKCPKNDGPHWAFFFTDSQAEYDYWNREHYDPDETRLAWWRHSDFISMACEYCGEQSPLHCQFGISCFKFQHLNGYTPRRCRIIDYHPDLFWPPDLEVARDQGWSYIYFKDTLSDSRFGNGTVTINPAAFQ